MNGYNQTIQIVRQLSEGNYRHPAPVRAADPRAPRIAMTDVRERSAMLLAIEHGAAGGRIGGVIRAERLSADQRSAIASKAAQARWSADRLAASDL